jgi:hypothetical protein
MGVPGCGGGGSQGEIDNICALHLQVIACSLGRKPLAHPGTIRYRSGCLPNLQLAGADPHSRQVQDDHQSPTFFRASPSIVTAPVTATLVAFLLYRLRQRSIYGKA